MTCSLHLDSLTASVIVCLTSLPQIQKDIEICLLRSLFGGPWSIFGRKKEGPYSWKL